MNTRTWGSPWLVSAKATRLSTITMAGVAEKNKTIMEIIPRTEKERISSFNKTWIRIKRFEQKMMMPCPPWTTLTKMILPNLKKFSLKSEEVFVKSEEVFVKSERDVFNEDIFACAKSLLETTKFYDVNGVELKIKINPQIFWKKPLKTYSCSSCESGVSCTGSPNQPETILKPKRPKGE